MFNPKTVYGGEIIISILHTKNRMVKTVTGAVETDGYMQRLVRVMNEIPSDGKTSSGLHQ